MTGWYAERTPGRSARAVIAMTLLALLLVAAVPVALLAAVVVMLLGHVVGGLALFGGSVLAAGLGALAGLDPAMPRHTAVAAYLHERDGDPVTAARLYAEAARSAPNLPERDHLTRQAARLNARLRS